MLMTDDDIETDLQQMQKNCTQFSSGFSKSVPLPIYTTHPPDESEKKIMKKLYMKEESKIHPINQDSNKDEERIEDSIYCYTND